jgi:serine/threonine protein kinase/tetratricopeptide (TPR) repeat protein
MPPHDDAPRDLLFGLLALQNGLVSRDQLVAAFGAWTGAPGRALADLLVEQGALDSDGRDLLLALADRHLKAHGGDPQRSLAALDVNRSTREGLAAAGGPAVEATLANVGSGPTPDGADDRTSTYAVGTATSAGQRFRVLRPHARGGLGAVFVALDAELNREVALKQLLDRHADDPESRQRFLREAEITGGLEHPGIVPVYGLGTYGGGRPYYAMRFIKGDSLKDAVARFHLDESLRSDPGRRSLELRKLLRRFLDVCNAVEYAHSRGVLHRDIKPGNVIVGRHGETLVVDWGLAKVAGRADPDPSADEQTLRPPSASGSSETLPGQAIGTPAYMSPEQARGDLGALGPRSDVYSLGATLYSLLTGKTPFEGGDISDVLRRVQAGEFSPPRALVPSIDRALEVVCLKAMALKPEDRYGSPRALAEDVERWAADEPVSAWREPFRRRARRWARRNRTAVTVAAVALVAGVVGLSALAAVQSKANRDLKKANDDKSNALKAETKAKKDTEEALAQSEESRKRAEGVLTFLKDDVLAAARPEGQAGGLGVAVTVRKAVDAAEPKIAERFKDQTLVEADVRNTLGLTYVYLREVPLAINQLERALELRRTKLGPDHPDTLASRNNLGEAYRAAGRTADAIRLHEATLKLLEMKLGPDHPSTLSSRTNLALAYRAAGRTAEAIALNEATLKLSEAKLGADHPGTLTSRNNLALAYSQAGRTADAIALHEGTLKQREAKLGPDHPGTLTSRNNLALAYSQAGRTAEAIALHEGTLKQREAKLGPDHPGTLTSRNNLAAAYEQAGRTADAIRLHEGTLKQREAKLGPDHPDTLTSRNNLAVAYEKAGRTAEAIALHQATLTLQEAKLGPDHPDTLASRSNLANAYRAAGRTADAIRLYESTLTLQEARLGPDHPDTLASRNNLAVAYLSAGRGKEAAQLHEATLKLYTAKLGPDHPDTLTSRNNLANAYRAAGRTADAIRLHEATLKQREARLGPDHPDTLASRNNLGEAYRAAGRTADAIALNEATLKLSEAKLGPDHPGTLTSRNNLAIAYESLGRWAGAETLRRQVLAQRRKTTPPDSPLLAGDLALLALDLLKQSKWPEAEPVLRECLAIREKKPPDDWSRFNTMSQLGGALLGKGQYATAEPLVVSGYEGMKAREAKIPAVGKPRLPEAAERVVRLYEAWGKPGKADVWKRKLGLADLPEDVFARP